MMEKRGDITDQTPSPQRAQDDQPASQPLTKKAADAIEDHPSVRAADAAAETAKPG
jgi:hypothetical protein